jgi:hypothetical protein
MFDLPLLSEYVMNAIMATIKIDVSFAIVMAPRMPTTARSAHNWKRIGMAAQRLLT